MITLSELSVDDLPVVPVGAAVFTAKGMQLCTTLNRELALSLSLRLNGAPITQYHVPFSDRLTRPRLSANGA